MLLTLLTQAVLWLVIWSAIAALVWELWIKREPLRKANDGVRTLYHVAWETRDGRNKAVFVAREQAEGFQDRLHMRGVASQMSYSSYIAVRGDVRWLPGAVARPRPVMPTLKLVKKAKAHAR